MHFNKNVFDSLYLIQYLHWKRPTQLIFDTKSSKQKSQLKDSTMPNQEDFEWLKPSGYNKDKKNLTG